MAGTAGIRVRAKETIAIGDIKVTNSTSNSIMVRKTARGLEIVDCCLEERGL